LAVLCNSGAHAINTIRHKGDETKEGRNSERTTM
jgi:hypothetical protein